eukprot:CAMPEP_0172491030 /NCGR_PEP_ID=MMETSP1066-20121228/21689_1 /TAXON_ID=671091 /ORGANISM="Coscinodiscus wailesii, Strain CCMP2513" /LENGTH=1419 /DNA_ID=CAMNT_0013259831 /DNA_START=315 /DNA_END=4573 /DNA_ORIENTATION=-
MTLLINHHSSFPGSPRDGILTDESGNEGFQTEFTPTITARYPLEDHDGNPLSESVACFCHPMGSIQIRTETSMPKVHYFVATGGKGQYMYGICLTLFEPHTLKSKDPQSPNKTKDVFLPKCLCILSAHPYLAAFREYLSQLNHLSKSGDMPLPLERYIVNFCSEIPAPPPGAFEVQTTISDSVIKLWSPPYNQPIAWVSLPFSHLFQCLDIDNVLLVWHALTLERQVLLTSTQLSLLTECGEILTSLLFPMRWSHAYIPVLPHFLIPILSAPMPYLCGIDKFNLPAALFDLSRECIVVDLDKNEVTFGPLTPSLPPLPKATHSSLKSKLEKNIGMVFREARCLSKADDYSERGIHLKSHVKEMSDAAWEGQLCLFDEAFQLYFTPEESRKNKLNGNDGSGGEGNGVKFLTRKDKLANMRSQSQWDGVQEAFLTGFVSLLSSYRRFLVFPSKSNEGSYGGAGFRSKQFVNYQRRDLQPFLSQLVGTQMFDDFITKRLYGSGESDVTFFDHAIDKYVKSNPEPQSAIGRMFRMNKPTETKKSPLLQSARVHRKLKTIVPPEPSCADLPLPGVEEGGTTKLGDAFVSVVHVELDDTASVGSHSTGGGSRYSYGSAPQRQKKPPVVETNEELEHGTSKYKYKYTVFPEQLDPKMFGTPRPLPSAVLAEFDRQREDAARFRRRTQDLPDDAGIDAQTLLAEKCPVSTNAEVATFTLFFMSFTSAVGKELLQISNEPRKNEGDKTILSDYVPPTKNDSKPDATASSTEVEADANETEVEADANETEVEAEANESVTEVPPVNPHQGYITNLVRQSSYDSGASDITESETVTFNQDEGNDANDADNAQDGDKDSYTEETAENKIAEAPATESEEPSPTESESQQDDLPYHTEPTDLPQESVDSILGSFTSPRRNVNTKLSTFNRLIAGSDAATSSQDGSYDNSTQDGEDEFSVENKNAQIPQTEIEEPLPTDSTVLEQESVNEILGSFTASRRNESSSPHRRTRSELPPASASPPVPQPASPAASETTTPQSKSHSRNLTLHDLPRNRFHDTLSNFKILEAKVRARAQLGLAFDMLDMMRQRQLKADPAAYQCLIDACGRCGDTERATNLLGRMHEDGIVADGVVYSCLVSAFSAENAWKKLTGERNDEHLPEWANGGCVEMDWNKLQKRSYLDIAMQHFSINRHKSSSQLNDDATDTDNDTSTITSDNSRGALAGLRQRFTKSASGNDVRSRSPPPATLDIRSTHSYDSNQIKKEMVMTKPVLMQVLLGENLLELIYPDISIDTDNELCPRCHMHLMDDDVVLGWTPCDSQDYTTTCPNCTLKFVPHFCVQSTSPSFIGSRGPSSPLFCERLSPWVLQKELRSIMSEGIENLLNPEWRESETKNATLWWNMVLSFMRYRLPFSFLLQGSFKTDLIVPTPEDEAGV